MTSAPAIGFEYHPSARLQRWMRWGLLAAWLSVELSGLAWWLKLLLAIAGLLAYLRWRRLARRMPLRAVACVNHGAWQVRLDDGRDVTARLVASHLLGENIVLLLAPSSGGRYGLFLGPDNLDADTRRRLRMRLVAGQMSEAAARL